MKPMQIAIAILVAIFWVSSLLFDSSSFFAFGLMFIAYWLSIFLVIGIVFSTIIPAWRKSSWRIRVRLLLIPLGLMAIAGISLLLNLLNTPPALGTGKTVSEELAYMVETDQADRYAIVPFLLIPERDTNRVNRVLEILAAEDILTAKDKYNAALILQHGSEPTHYETAYQLAFEANETGYSNELWKLAYDRWQLSIGNEQVYGTQSSITFGPGIFKQEKP